MNQLKHQKKEVTNEEYNEAYNNIHNRRVTNKVLSLYKGRIDSETLKALGLQGLWRCLQFHDPNRENKFTTSLWRFVIWACESEIKRLSTKKNSETRKKIQYSNMNFDYIGNDIKQEFALDVFTDIDDLLEEEYSTILKLRFQKGMTLKEIGEQFGYTKEAARQKLNNALIQVKRLVYKLE